MRVWTRCRAYVSRGSGNRRKTMKAYESEHCGWFHEGFGMGESMRATWQGNGNPICRHFCADIVRLFISTPYEIERKGQIKAGWRKEKREWEGERKRTSRFIAVLAYCRGFTNVFFFFHLFYLRCTPRERLYNSTVCIGHTPSTAGSVSSLHTANFARFHATTSHDTAHAVVNFKLTDDSRSVSEYRREVTPFSRGPAACVHRLDVVENHTLYRTFLLSFFCFRSRKMWDLSSFANVK